MRFNLFTKNTVLGIILMSLIFGGISMQPKQAHAIPVVVVANSSPTAISDTINIYAERVKNWVLDGLAWHIAKMIVQRITASVVQWINSGFSGSPSFLTNPGGFFSNIGDQVTGDFIAKTGILSGLCSPFNIDVRLSLALGQAGYGQIEKYTCTLSTVISNVKNTTVNGASIKGFMNGDFKQGGWPAFIEVTRPTNNTGGVYLKAHSDLLQRIGSQQGQKQQQLLQGGGFLSWDKCNDISTEDLSSINTQAENDGTYGLTGKLNQQGNQRVVLDPGQASGGQTSVRKNVDSKTGLISYQSCETQTPGSVINGQLEKSLGSGIDQLNLANSINEIVDALMAQLVNKVLQTGLGAVSSRPSGQTQSYIEQLTASTTDPASFQNDAQGIQSGFADFIAEARTVKDLRQSAVDAFEVARSDYGFAQRCFESLGVNRGTMGQLDSIKSELSQLDSAEKPYLDNLATASSTLSDLIKQSNAASEIGSVDSLKTASSKLQYLVANRSTLVDTTGPQSDLDTAKSTAATYDTQATNYLQECRALGGN
jgi:hypothetical protein